MTRFHTGDGQTATESRRETTRPRRQSVTVESGGLSPTAMPTVSIKWPTQWNADWHINACCTTSKMLTQIVNAQSPEMVSTPVFVIGDG